MKHAKISLTGGCTGAGYMHSIGWQKQTGQQPASFFEAGLELASILHRRLSLASLTAARESRASSRGVGQIADDVLELLVGDATEELVHATCADDAGEHLRRRRLQRELLGQLGALRGERRRQLGRQ